MSVNPKRLCFYKAQHYEIGFRNSLFLSAEKSLAFRKSRKLNLLNQSEYTYLSGGIIGHIRNANFYLGPTVNLQLGIAKTWHLWPTVRYTYLVNVPSHPNRISVGLSWLPLKNCGLNYSYTLNNKQHQNFAIAHQIGISINIKHRTLDCVEKNKK